jgi:hypothetical protein
MSSPVCVKYQAWDSVCACSWEHERAWCAHVYCVPLSIGVITCFNGLAVLSNARDGLSAALPCTIQAFAKFLKHLHAPSHLWNSGSYPWILVWGGSSNVLGGWWPQSFLGIRIMSMLARAAPKLIQAHISVCMHAGCACGGRPGKR